MKHQHPIVAQNITLRIPLTRKTDRKLVADPLSLLAGFYKPAKIKREVRTLIDDLSFQVEDGWRLGLIGRNGAGKTTLLRLLAGAYHPSKGNIATRGRVQALLNLSLGLSTSATGLENIYLQGLAFGMRMEAIQDKVDEIVEFTELGDAIYDPIQTYSAGMRARLAFGIATSREPNILLMDEWISTGDKYFVSKAQARLRSQLETCHALVLASHSGDILDEICTHGLVLERGQALYLGKIEDALKFYEEMDPRQVGAKTNV